jgi:type IV pilus assembly protein PilV
VTLIEVLIAIVVLAVGLLGIAALQASALTNNSVSYQYTQVATLAQGLVERMRANRSAVIAGNYTLTAGGPAPAPSVNCSTSTANCTPAQTALFDLGVWYQSLSGTQIANVPSGVSSSLTSGSGSVMCGDSTCTTTSNWIITVYWDSDRTGRSTFGCSPTVSSDLNCYRLIYRP